MSSKKALFTSDKKNWTSPATVMDRVRKVFAIGLDPCHCVGSIVGARVTVDEKQDGLSKPWPKVRANEGTYVNWPYGNKENKAWAQKVVAQLSTHPEQICLVAARTSEIWLQDHILAAKPTAIAFCHKRLKFSNAKHVAPFPSMLVYFGKHLDKFTKAFEDLCWVVPRPKRGTYPLGIHRTVVRKPKAKAKAVVKAVPVRKPAVKAVKRMLDKPAAKKIVVAKAKAPVLKAPAVRLATPKTLAVASVRVPTAPKPQAVQRPLQFGRIRIPAAAPIL